MSFLLLGKQENSRYCQLSAAKQRASKNMINVDGKIVDCCSIFTVIFLTKKNIYEFVSA